MLLAGSLKLDSKGHCEKKVLNVVAFQENPGNRTPAQLATVNIDLATFFGPSAVRNGVVAMEGAAVCTTFSFFPRTSIGHFGHLRRALEQGHLDVLQAASTCTSVKSISNCFPSVFCRACRADQRTYRRTVLGEGQGAPSHYVPCTAVRAACHVAANDVVMQPVLRRERLLGLKEKSRRSVCKYLAKQVCINSAA